ncbi:hypothetical protein CMT77_10205 [Elizabethkingia anophelis]|nr:hypothetical protein [Elizabethkingia anophelis]
MFKNFNTNGKIISIKIDTKHKNMAIKYIFLFLLKNIDPITIVMDKKYKTAINLLIVINVLSSIPSAFDKGISL